MTKRHPFLLTLLMAALLAPLCFAQVSGDTNTTKAPSTDPVAERVAFLAKLLDLTTAQQTQAADIFTSEQTALQSLKPKMTAAQKALDTAVLASSLAAISAAAAQIGDLTAQQIVTTASADVAFRAILTPDQQSKYNSLRSVGVGGPKDPASTTEPAPKDPSTKTPSQPSAPSTKK